MKAIFLSDAHLRRRDDLRYRKLLHFIDGIKGRINHLYLVGDFFDFWFCSDNKIHPEYVPVIKKLLELQCQGIEIHLCEGNHDFFLGSYFAGRLGMEVFSDWAAIDLDGKKILLGHGDTVDHLNARYLFLRKVLRSKAFYRFQHMIPAVLRWRLASLSSDLSKEVTEESKEQLVSKMEAFSEMKFQEGYDVVILGHCHRPLLKQVTWHGIERTFVSLGDWVEYCSYLSLENGKFRLEFFNP